MTLKDLRLMLERSEREDAKLRNQLGSSQSEANQLLVKRLANRSFWCGNIEEVNPNRPCWNHFICLPLKNNVAHPIYPWQMELINDLESGIKYQILKKSRGIGVTTLYLRYCSWLGVCKNDTYRNTRFALICGPREAMALDLIRRLKMILLPLGIVDETEKTVCRFLNVTIEAFPSARVSTMRGYDDLKFAYIDEASFFGSGGGNSKEEQEVRSVVEGYIAKTGLKIVMVSTPSVPSTMFEQIMEESETTCMYKRYRLPYTVALERPGEPGSGIYSQSEIDQARLSPVFSREYELAYSIGIGTVFLESNIKKCMMEYNQPTAEELSNVVINLGVDIGFATSKTACVASAILRDRIYILEASEFERVSFSHSVNVVASIMKRYGYSAYRKNVIVLTDGSRPEWTKELKSMCGEDPNFDSLIDYSEKYHVPIDSLMSIIPISFGKFGKQLLSHFQSLVSDHALAIDGNRFSELILQMRMSRIKVNQMLDKSGSSLDLIDAAMLSVWNVKTKL